MTLWNYYAFIRVFCINYIVYKISIITFLALIVVPDYKTISRNRDSLSKFAHEITACIRDTIILQFKLLSMTSMMIIYYYIVMII